MAALGAAHDALLNAIEDVELLSLRWGDVSASLGRDEALEIAEAHFPGEAEDGLEALVEAALVVEFDVPGRGPRYRSRFGETVRLLARMRQTFAGESWRGAPPLVADYRLDVRARRYPRWDQDSGAAADAADLTALQRAVWRAIAPGALAAFQLRAADRLLPTPGQDVGVIVGAGTGSGKTLAFYLPVFTRLAERVRTGDFWTKAIAIYPRNELLKDQLSEAYGNAVALVDTLAAAGRRPIRLGAFYGDTPTAGREEAVARVWRRRRTAYVCPYLRCGCGGDMVWSSEDIAQGVERLQCARSCGSVTDPEVLVLTRDRLRREPPDLLFTTTEMLNRSLSDQRRRGLFGVRTAANRRPEFLLLDEAHTYTGVAGAQAALTLRRWRRLAGGPIAWVGLSATLQDAATFFAELTGLPPGAVAEVTPQDDEYVEEGREYQIALRGDPAAGTSLLSTSIQTAMLAGRILDPPGGPSQFRFGERMFAFTDDLDVTHRLFDDLRDAEAFDRFGNPDPARLPLAAMRGQAPPGLVETDADRRARDADGQRWRLPEVIGRALSDRLTVARTTSRDPGVDAAANIIVATSALEVGFNDRRVGAVLQHKAPRDFASFLQRRGRAGRDRRMRPLTLTVLSDYGRDRQLFQAAEHLFEPTLPPQSLPIRNEYVLRMQAAFALLDWIADQPRPPGTPTSSAWQTVAQPSRPAWDDAAWRDHIARLLSEVLRADGPLRRSLADHLKASLRLDDTAVASLLWEPPRSLLLEVIPTLSRRMYRNWRLAWPNGAARDDLWIRDHPLPDFAPSALFADLNLPELEIVHAGDRQGDPDVTETLALQQGLAQLAPGRVTRRFGDAYGGLAHWSPVPAGITQWDLDVAAYAETSEPLGPHRGEGAGGWIEAQVFRPWRLRLDKATRGVVGVTSNSRLSWSSAFQPHGEPVQVAPPARTAWQGFVEGADIYLHRFRASVGVSRFASEARAELRRPGGVDQIVDITFRDGDGALAAVGFDFETDGLALRLRLPPAEALAEAPLEPHLQRTLHTSLHRWLTAEDRQFPRETNGFLKTWLRQVHLLCCARRALDRGETLQRAADAVDQAGSLADYDDVMNILLGVQRADVLGAEDDDDDPAPDHAGPTRPLRDRLERLKGRLQEALRDGSVRARLHANLLAALDAAGPERARYLRVTLVGTLAEGLLTAAVAATPRQAAADAILADLETDPADPRRATLWLTETTLGGAGVLQSIADRFAGEPRALYRGIEAALEPSDLEVASGALARTYGLAAREPAVAEAIARVRAELGHVARAAARADLLLELDRHGVETTRAFVVTLSARMLTPGIGPRHDDLVRRLLAFWEETEARLGVELDPREAAVLATADQTAADLALAAGVFEAAAPPGDRALAFGALLWPRTLALHRQALSNWNPFRGDLPADPALVRALLLEGGGAAIPVTDDDWWERLAATLAQEGVGRLSAPLARRDRLGEALVATLVRPIHVGHLQLFPVLERIAKDETQIVATLVLREQI
ncbi:protein DpdJ [Phenylobacterium sp.]|uniref:protein DpdJ n=1 Tax=Phenylobacterium sp. TaxID=1871053 RepID=UPI0035653BC1